MRCLNGAICQLLQSKSNHTLLNTKFYTANNIMCAGILFLFIVDVISIIMMLLLWYSYLQMKITPESISLRYFWLLWKIIFSNVINYGLASDLPGKKMKLPMVLKPQTLKSCPQAVIQLFAGWMWEKRNDCSVTTPFKPLNWLRMTTACGLGVGTWS